MSNLLINEPPLMVLPSLACIIGLNESIVLQQIHYWLNPRINKTIKDQHHWVYNSYEQWKGQFPFWSIVTIKRTFQSLEKMGLLISKNLNTSGFNKTKWYRINYQNLEAYAQKQSTGSECNDRWDQNDPSMGSACSQDQINMTPSYIDTETTTETPPSPLSSSTISLKKKKEERREDMKEKESTHASITMITLWKQIIGKGEGSLTNRPARTLQMKTVLSRYFHNNMAEWESYCRKLTTSKFLMGDTKEKFSLNIDWAIKHDTIEKVLDGSIVLGTREHPLSGDNFLEEAKLLYERLSAQDIERYKNRFVDYTALKEPGFKKEQLEENIAFYSGRLRHFILTELIKKLAHQGLENTTTKTC